MRSKKQKPSTLNRNVVMNGSLSTAAVIIDRDFNIKWNNEIYAILFGPAEKSSTCKCYEAYGNRSICEDCPSIKVFKHGLSENAVIKKDVKIRGGEIRHFRITVNPIRDERGDVTQVLKLMEDVTDHIRLENDFKEIVTKELDSIYKLDQKFISFEELSLDDILQQSAEIAPALVGSNICSIRLIDSSRKTIDVRVGKGLRNEFIRNSIITIGEGIVGTVASSKEPIIVRDILERRDIKYSKELKKEGIRSFVCVPIVLNSVCMGTLTVYDKKIDKFNSKDGSLLANFANHIAILIDNIRVHRQVFMSHINTIKALASAVEARDAYTRGHSEKVTKYSLDIAHLMGVTKENKVMLSYCGRLHDIGKIAISDNILNKKGVLTKNERKEIEKHPMKGVEILSKLKFLDNSVPVIKYHHERYDGKGYPDGIKGKDIPILSRIIGCADAFDAMTSDRAYRKRMSLEKALRELKINKGKQFDPEILDIFISLVSKESYKTSKTRP